MTVSDRSTGQDAEALRLMRASQLLGLRYHTALGLVLAGKLQGVQSNGRWFVSASSVEKERVARIHAVAEEYGIASGHELLAKCLNDSACTVPQARDEFEIHALEQRRELKLARQAVAEYHAANGGRR